MEIVERELTTYQKNKEAIYKWRSKNLEKFGKKMQEYNRQNYLLNKEAIKARVKANHQKKLSEKETIKQVGRPRKLFNVFSEEHTLEHIFII